jgi:hypothetical protein
MDNLIKEAEEYRTNVVTRLGKPPKSYKLLRI